MGLPDLNGVSVQQLRCGRLAYGWNIQKKTAPGNSSRPPFVSMYLLSLRPRTAIEITVTIRWWFGTENASAL